MDTIGKFLFRNHPEIVRYRKLRELYFALILSVTASVAVGAMIFFINRLGLPH